MRAGGADYLVLVVVQASMGRISYSTNRSSVHASYFLDSRIEIIPFLVGSVSLQAASSNYSLSLLEAFSTVVLSSSSGLYPLLYNRDP